MSNDGSPEELPPSVGVLTFCQRLVSMELVGASACVRELCDVLARQYDGTDLSGPSAAQSIRRDIAYLAYQIEETKPATSLYRLVLDLLRTAAVVPTEPASTKQVERAVLATARAISSWLHGSTRQVAEQCTRVLENSERLLVYDYSSTVIAALRAVAAKRGLFRLVIVPECRITGLGARVAELVAPFVAAVEIVADSALASVMKDIDTVLLGAEVITASGDLINTMGTQPLVEAAARRGVAAYALSSALKVEEGSSGPLFAEMLSRRRPVWYPPGLIPSGTNISVRSHLLESTPGSLLAGYILENGLVRADAVFSAFRAVSEAFEDEVSQAVTMATRRGI